MAHHGARIDTTIQERGLWHIAGQMPARLVYEFQDHLPGLSHGEGVWTSVPEGDRVVAGVPPRRPRTDGNPFDRSEYLRFLAQRQLAT